MLRRLAPLVPLALLAACPEPPSQGRDYYDRVIQPLLDKSCSQGTSGCHSADPADPFAFAAGNLDTTSFENVHRRPDLLRAYGAYPVPLFLIKAVDATDELQIAYGGAYHPVEIPHAGGAIFAVGSPAYLTLQQWLENGATRDGLPPPDAPVPGAGDCSTAIPADFDPASVTGTPEWGAHGAAFGAVQQVLLEKGCAAANCHGAPQADFYFTCGATDAQRAFNFHQVWAFVGSPVDDSEILNRPLAPTAGGTVHSGGVHWTSRSDAAYRTIRAFAAQVGRLEFGQGDPGKRFFADHVMPVFLKRGCAAEGCHSPAAGNDFKLRPGTRGFFSAIALERNYDLTRREFAALEVPDVRRSRFVAKNVLPSWGGIAHKGGPLLETPGAGPSDPAACPAPYDPAAATAFCTIVEWARIERAAMGNPNAGPTLSMVYVDRQATHVATPLELHVYQPGSDLMVADLTVDALGRVTGFAGTRSILDGCAGAASRAAVDVRRPDVRLDGTSVVFAMRLAEGQGTAIWRVDLSGAGCQKLTDGAAGVHDVDPAWSPDGEWIVFASTRAGGTSLRLGLPQADLWRMRPDGSGLERITFLSNSELGPAFMRDGRITMTTEKVDPRDPTGGFYQLSGRRLNWDLTDYHPLVVQRATSPVRPGNPGDVRASVGFQQALSIREGLDGNFLMILSDAGTRGGAGTVGIFNRSVGTFEEGRNDPGYMPSVHIPDRAATGRGTSQGAYRTPFPMPDGRILVSYAPGSVDLTSTAALAFDLVALDPRTGARQTILAAPGSQVDAVLALAHPPRKLYYNRRQLVFGGAAELPDPSRAIAHFPDAPMLATLLGSNLRRGRGVADFRGADRVVFLDRTGAPIGGAPLAADGSARVRVPAATPLLIGLAQGQAELFMMTEEHQFGPGEVISLGISEALFDPVCGSCHGSASGRELDVAVRPDALTGASFSLSAEATPAPVGP